MRLKIDKESDTLYTTPQFWLVLQANYDLALHRPTYTVAPLALVA